MNKAVTDLIASYKTKVSDNLRNAQSALTPCIDPFIYECQVTEYKYNAHRTLIMPIKEVCFRMHYMYLKPMSPRKYLQYLVSNTSIGELVANDVIFPFLLFINKKMVPWSMINIILSYETYFILCHTNDKTWQNEFKDVRTVDVLYLPDGCRYSVRASSRSRSAQGNNDDNISAYADFSDTPSSSGPFLPEIQNTIDRRFYGEIIMSFNNDGTYCDNDETAPISIISSMTYMDFKSFFTTSWVNAYAVDEDTTIKYFPNNVVLFRNNLLDTDSKIDFKSTLLSINDGVNPNRDRLNFIVFRDKRTVPSTDNIAKANLRYIRPYVQNMNGGLIEIPAPMKQLFNNEFSFEMDYKKNYPTNVAESIDYIIKYNASLFEEAYLKNYRNLYIEQYEGQEVLNRLTEDNVWNIPCKHTNFSEERIIMLINGLFYKFTHMTKYTNHSYCSIPIQNIEPSDKIELFRFTDINNDIHSIRITEEDNYQEYDENYINDDMVLFSNIPPTDDYQFQENGIQHFPIDYTIRRNPSNKNQVKIILPDSRYYGQLLTVAYKHRFKHKWYVIDEELSESGTYHIDLGTDFMYCYDYSKYLVFYNGRRLSTDQYRLCLPVRSTTPFKRFEIFLTALVEEGDRIDIIYTSSLIKDVVLKDSIDSNGIIEVDKNDITYSLTKDTYMVWANGKKIPSDHVTNIDSTHLKITEDIGTTKTVCVTKFLYDIDDLTKAFRENESLWDKIISQLTEEQVNALLNISSSTLTNTEAWIYDDNIPIKAVMYELIREKFIMDGKVDTTGSFAYGYTDVDDTIIDKTDSAGNVLLRSNDSNIRENISDVERPWP